MTSQAYQPAPVIVTTSRPLPWPGWLFQVIVPSDQASFSTPQHATSETFGQDLRLLGYDVAQDAEALRLTLHWRAERRMSHYYKFFVHLFVPDTLELVAQADVVPRDWTYPTTWWEAGEVVSDEIILPLEGVPGGWYALAVGVYTPDEGRLLTGDGADRFILGEEVVVP